MTEKLKPKIESLETSTTEIYSGELYAKVNKLLDKLDENSSKNDWRENLILSLKNIGVDINHSNFQEKIKIIYKNIFEKDFDKNNDIGCFLELKEFILKSLESNFSDEFKNFISENFTKNIVSKLSNSFTEFIYFSDYKDKTDMDFIQKTLKEIMDGKLSQKIGFNKIKDNILKENKDYIEKSDKIKTALELYEKSADYPTDNDNTDFDKYLKDIKNKGLDFRKKGNELYIYTDEGIFIQNISISVENYQFIFEDILKKYEKTPIKGLIEFDQETKITPGYVSDTKVIEGLEIPKIYADNFDRYIKKGYIFEITSTNGDKFSMIIKKGDYVVYSTNNFNKGISSNLWLDKLFINLKKIDSSKSDRINNPSLDIKKSSEQKIDFVNKIYDLIIDESGKVRNGITFDKDLNITNIINIGLSCGLPLDQIFSQIPFIIDRLPGNIGNNFLKYLLNNLEKIPKRSFLDNYNITQEDYINTLNQFSNFSQSIFIKMIQNFPEKSLERIYQLSEYYMDTYINFDLNGINDKQGVNYIIIFIIDTILKSSQDPESIIKTPKMQQIFSDFPYIKDYFSGKIKRVSELRTTVGSTSGTTLKDLESSAGGEKIEQIRIRIKTDWIKKYPLSKHFGEKEVQELKIAIARNLYLQYYDKEDYLNDLLNNDPKKLVEENLKTILDTRKTILKQEIFGSDLFYLAHFGQDVGFDAMGTTITQTALKNQTSGEYNFFDAQDISKKSTRNGKSELNNFYNSFITNPNTATFLMEGHGANELFSVLDKYDTVDKMGINKTGSENISLTYKDLADIVIKRHNFKKENNIKNPDTIIFSACRGDFAINFYNELNNRSIELGESFIPPIMMTAAESGQNSLFSPVNIDKEIPYSFLRYGLDIGSDKKSTFGAFFKNQHSEKMGSNPSLFYPIKINGKWVPQQLG